MSVNRENKKSAMLPWITNQDPKVKYPIFIDMLNINTSEYWETVLKKLSRGDIPRVTYYSQTRILAYKFSNKIKKITMYPNKLEESFNKLKIFLNQNINCSDPNMVPPKSATFKPITQFNNKLSECRKRDLVEYFVNHYKQKYNFTPDESNLMKTIINLGINIPYFGVKNICIDENTISAISNFNFDPQTRKFVIDKNNVKEPKNNFQYFRVTEIPNMNLNLSVSDSTNINTDNSPSTGHYSS